MRDRGLVLPQVAMPDLVDSTRKALLSLGCRCGMGKREEDGEKGREWELGLVCKMKSIFNKK